MAGMNWDRARRQDKVRRPVGSGAITVAANPRCRRCHKEFLPFKWFHKLCSECVRG